jgi:hypothetical protein
LEEGFQLLADRAALDVCTYRLFRNVRPETMPTLRGFSGALYDFQTAVSAMFDALKNGPRLRSRFAPDVIEATTFGFGYAFAGSVGVVLTLPRERPLFGGGLLEDTITTFFSVARAPRHEDIREIGRRLGPAPLRAVYNWANVHVEDGISADISWRQGAAVKETLFLEHRAMEQLRDAIAATSDETTEIMEVPGVLTRADLQTHRFRLQPDVGEDVSGSFTDAINDTHAVTLPARYRARLERTVKVQYSSEQEQITCRDLAYPDVGSTGPSAGHPH